MKKETSFAFSDRAELLTLGVDLGEQKGLEFGALNNPVVRRVNGNIRFVDYTSTEGLRAHPHADTIDTTAIVDVDYVWSGSGSLAEVVQTGEMFDFAIASHVIEHVPNIVGWFNGIADVLKAGGVFNIAIPDKRYTFDVRRRLTTLGDLIEAHLLNFTYPSIRQMFDHCYEAVAIEPGAIWLNDIDVNTLSRISGADALQFDYDQSVDIFKNKRYIDSHCLIITPISFLNLIVGLSRLHLFPFILRNFYATKAGAFEFFANFEKPGEMNVSLLLEQQLFALERHIKDTSDSLRIAALSAHHG